MASIGKLWGQIKYFHPYLGYKEINLDSALVQAVPKIKNSKTQKEYAAAVQSMLIALEDPLTKVLPFEKQFVDTSVVQAPSFSWTKDSILIISINDYRALEDYVLIFKKFNEFNIQIKKSRGLLFDLRNRINSDEDFSGYFSWYLSDSKLDRHLISQEILLPGKRERKHYGFIPESGSTSGDYYSSFDISNCRLVKPIKERDKIPVVFLLNSKSDLPYIALAMQKEGLAKIIFSGKGSPFLEGNKTNILISDSLHVSLRTGDIVFSNGSTNFYFDKEIPDNENAISIALDEVKNFDFIKKKKGNSFYQTGITSNDIYQHDKDFPSEEYRLLAAFKIWTIFKYFFPYKDLMETDWDKVLWSFIPKFENVKTLKEYQDVIKQMLVHTHDSHVRLKGQTIENAHPLFYSRFIDNKLTD